MTVVLSPHSHQMLGRKEEEEGESTLFDHLCIFTCYNRIASLHLTHQRVEGGQRSGS